MSNPVKSRDDLETGSSVQSPELSQSDSPLQFEFPAPWALTGMGIILAFRFSEDWMSHQYPEFRGRIGFAMWVNYQDTPVGPYNEWLMIPGQLDNPEGKHFSISQIMVDSKKSLRGGRENWGIPKEMAKFDYQMEPDEKSWCLKLSYKDGNMNLIGRRIGPSIPIHSALAPLTLYQQQNGLDYWTKPTAKGWGKWFKVDKLEQTGNCLPPLAGIKPFAALAIHDFSMVFNPAKITQSY